MVTLSRSLNAPLPEPEATRNAIILDEHDTTGPLPVGFEFERFGMRYDHFDLSSDGFVMFGSGTYPRGCDSCLPFGPGARSRLGGGQVAYEVRGRAPRRRLVVSFAEPGVRRPVLQLVVHERTGIIEVSAGPTQSLGDPTIRQLDIAQPPVSRANSARKIG